MFERDSSDEAAEFAASWQTANPNGGQLDVVTDADGNIVSSGPVIFPDDYDR